MEYLNATDLVFGGQINSDAIRKHPFLSMTQGLALLAKNNGLEEVEYIISSFRKVARSS